MKIELAPKYESNRVEEGKYQHWIEKGYFECGKDKSKTPFCIVIPPPNVTGKLHLGHAWDVTLQDMIIRYKRMKGFDVLWLPGMDHAGIATQAKVEQKLREQGISRYDLGREKFLEVTWAWKKEYAEFIRAQWAKLGASVDYTKERFTLDEGLNAAVRKVFVSLYKKGLIYRGERIINWDPVQKTALSNIEVVYKESESYMYYFKYVVENEPENYLLVATTRPETMFGDVCVVVHPEDPRYKNFVGKKVYNPANGQLLPIITDDYIDIEFGTGAMKCTPAHDPNDFTIGEKYGFPKPVCMNPDGTMNELAHKYKDMDRFVCREALLKDLEEQGLFVKKEKHVNQVGHSERSDAIVEPYLSKQWFVKMEPLANASLNFQKTDDRINFVPERFEKTFTNWMNGIQDWCISRQLWWGHRIPAWYHNETGEVYVDELPPSDIENYTQDTDVLDTWFSSGLWPFSTLGWPEKTEDLERYFPTDVLVTGYDIIFFWVSRMIFQSLEFTKQKPFKEVLLHGLIRDSQGRKMSKSLGNGVDPMDVIAKYGADALRFFLTTNSAPGLDLRYSEEKVNASWNFINKIWNSARFTMMNLGEDFKYEGIEVDKLGIYDRWILNRLNNSIKIIDESMDKYEFVVAGSELYRFIWDDFCSWYVEMAKLSLNGNSLEAKKATQNTLFYCLECIVKLIHPYMPFVSEEIYQTLHGDKEVTITTAPWPTINPEFSEGYDDRCVNGISDIITTIRTMRSEENIAPSKPIDMLLIVENDEVRSQIETNKRYLERFCFAPNIEITKSTDILEKGKTFVLSNITVFVPLKGLINFEEEIKRLEQEIIKLENEIKRCNNMLNNPNFVSKAPEAKIAQERAKLQDYTNKLEITKVRLEEMK